MIRAREREAITVVIRSSSGVNLLLGLWLVASPFALGHMADPVPTWNAIGTGVLISTLSAVRLGVPSRSAWMSWINAALGAWLVAAPVLLNYRLGAGFLNDVLTGLAVAFLARRSAAAGPPD